MSSQDKDGWTALLIAAYGGKREIIELFMEKRLDLNSKNEEGKTALMAAAHGGHPK